MKPVISRSYMDVCIWHHSTGNPTKNPIFNPIHDKQNCQANIIIQVPRTAKEPSVIYYWAGI